MLKYILFGLRRFSLAWRSLTMPAAHDRHAVRTLEFSAVEHRPTDDPIDLLAAIGCVKLALAYHLACRETTNKVVEFVCARVVTTGWRPGEHGSCIGTSARGCRDGKGMRVGCCGITRPASGRPVRHSGCGLWVMSTFREPRRAIASVVGSAPRGAEWSLTSRSAARRRPVDCAAS